MLLVGVFSEPTIWHRAPRQCALPRGEPFLPLPDFQASLCTIKALWAFKNNFVKISLLLQLIILSF